MSIISIKDIKFKNGESIKIDKNDILLVVGPNNSGKSILLKEIKNLIGYEGHSNIVLDEVLVHRNIESDEIINLLEEQEKIFISKTSSTITQGIFTISAPRHALENALKNNRIGMFSNLLVKHLGTLGRLKAVDAPKAVKMTTPSFTHPIHFLYRDDELEFYFSDLFKQAFGMDLILNRAAGDFIPLHVGERPKFDEGEDRISLSYVKKIESLPLLSEQGDGMKSFVGILLNIFVTDFSVVLIDEPESFLHPPQARLLGKMIGGTAPKDRQLILATHSGDFLRGLLDAFGNKLRIIRIDRNGNENIINELKPDEVSDVWNDTLLRHSNILDGVFHSKVILCESDSDCRFYSVMFEQLLNELNYTSKDYMFIHCGGKHRLPKVIRALASLKVPVEVIADFDILNNMSPLKQVVTELKGNWSEVEKKWRIIKNAIDKKKPELETSDVKEQIFEILSRNTSKVFPEEEVKNINEILRKASAWRYAKQVGKTFIPSGQATENFNELNNYFSKIGLHIVEVGELEGFCRSVGNHGPKWVEEVLKRDVENDKEFDIVKEFMKKML